MEQEQNQVRLQHLKAVVAAKKAHAAWKKGHFRLASKLFATAADNAGNKHDQMQFRKLARSMKSQSMAESEGIMTMTEHTIVEEIHAELTERKGKKVNVRRLKVGDTIALPVFPQGRRKMVHFKVTGVTPHAAGGFTVKASSMKPGQADTSRTFSDTDHVTLIEDIEDETLAEAMGEDKVMDLLNKSKTHLIQANALIERLPAKIEGRRVAEMADLKELQVHLKGLFKGLRKIERKVLRQDKPIRGTDGVLRRYP